MKRGMIGLTVRPFNGWLSPKLATTSAGVVTNFTGFTENRQLAILQRGQAITRRNNFSTFTTPDFDGRMSTRPAVATADDVSSNKPGKAHGRGFSTRTQEPTREQRHPLPDATVGVGASVD